MSVHINDEFGAHNADSWQHWAAAYAKLYEATTKFLFEGLPIEQLAEAHGYSFGELYTALGIPEERALAVMGNLVVKDPGVGSGGDRQPS